MALSKYFYNQSIKKYTYVFGTLFNDIKIKRRNSANNSVYEQIVPIVYSNKHNFVLRKNQESQFGDKKFQIKLPRMGYSLVNLSYDPNRQRTSSIKHRNAVSDNNKMNRMFEPVPYNLSYELYIKTRDQENLWQILEQILPFFKTDLTLNLNLLDGMDFGYDIAFNLADVNLEDTYEADFENNREILSTLSFDVSGYLFGPITEKPVIKFANVSVYGISSANQDFAITNNQILIANTSGDPESITIRPTLTNANTPTSNVDNSVGIDSIDADDNYGIVVIRE